MDTRMQTPYRGSGPGVVFLSPHIFLIPNPYANTLDVFRIPPSGPTPCDLANHLIVSFHLPELLAPTNDVHWVECVSAPNPCEKVTSPGRVPFLNAAHKAIIYLQYVVDKDVTNDDDDDEDDEVAHDQSKRTFFILREPLMRLVQQSSNACQPQQMNWPLWGPQCLHSFEAVEFQNLEAIGTTAGQRIVSMGPGTGTGNLAPIRILNFNPYTVAHCGHATKNGTNASIRVVGPGAVDAHSFAEPVQSSFSYVETLSHQSYNFDTVMINNENIIGVKVSAAVCDYNSHSKVILTVAQMLNESEFKLTVFHFGSGGPAYW
jgi:hypothetical protein